jgi:hypothetical protein
MKHENIFIHWLQVMGVNIHFTHIKLGHMIPNICDDVLIIKIATLLGKYYSNLSKKKRSHDSVYNYKSYQKYIKKSAYIYFFDFNGI